jgi:predicted O-linked N-acetylglucosamine transferase (SPINDLY family)
MATKSGGSLHSDSGAKSLTGGLTTPGEQEVRIQQAVEFHRAGRLSDAEAIYRQILEKSPECAGAWYLLGVLACQAGQHAAALELTDAALGLQPDFAEAWGNRGIALSGLGHYKEARESFSNAIGIKHDFAEGYEGRANALYGMGRYAEALTDYDVAARLRPGYAEAHHGRGNALHGLERYAEALQAYGAAVAARPNFPEAYCNRGITLYALGRYQAAASSCAEAIQLAPGFAEAHLHLGNARHASGDSEAALESYEKAVQLRPEFAQVYFNRGVALQALSRVSEALESYDKSITLNPAHAEAHNNRGCALNALMRYGEAVPSFDTAIALKPDLAEAHSNRGNAMLVLGEYQSALESFEKAMLCRPNYEWAAGMRLHVKGHLCDWNGIESDCQRLEAAILRGEKVVPPFGILAASSSALVHRRAAEIFAREKHTPRSADVKFTRRSGKTRICIGYFSSDFHNHATSYLIAELFERHDREHFEIIGFSFGPNPADKMNRRVSAAMDRFLDVRTMTDRDIARLSRELGVDIAVDLKGFTWEARTGIFAERAAPIQVNYLGYPGTMGAEYMDYLIADSTVIPESDQEYYAEKIITLPDCYQPNDSQREISPKRCVRKDEGLPERGFVFCCFNSAYKITPAAFDSWMSILGRVQDSVLWLLGENRWIAGNLRKEADRRGISPQRLIFAQPLPLAEHLARLSLADMFLDTFPYGAHTTASDALWVGLPLLTRTGETFASRVAASLLRASGLPELVTATASAFEKLAVDLAHDPRRLHALRQRLQQNRLTCPLFDCETFTRHIEAAYSAINKRYQAGLPTEHVRVVEHFS